MKPSPYIDNQGQIFPFSLLILFVSLILIFQLLRFSRLVERKITLQNGIDAALLSGTEHLARGLNEISHLNQKIKFYHKLLILVRAGEVVNGGGGLMLTEKVLEHFIQWSSKKQDWIKNTYPIKATQTVFQIGNKDGTPHLFLNPPFLFYAIEREKTQPKLYQLKKDFREKEDWSIYGIYYRGGYKAKAKTKLLGTDLLSPDWKGVFIE